MVEARPEGLYCPAGNFFIDPWRPVPWAIITHAHSDHARRGCGKYLAHTLARQILYKRLGEIELQTVNYGEEIHHRGVTISLHPAGHIIGSSQVRLEYRGEVWVISGDYKIEADGIHNDFESVRCNTFVTESTFGLPIYQWQPQALIQSQINEWWQNNVNQERTSILFCYALGKAQRVLSLLDPSIGPIITHGAVEPINQIYRQAGVRLPETQMVNNASKESLKKALVIAPPSASPNTLVETFWKFF